MHDVEPRGQRHPGSVIGPVERLVASPHHAVPAETSIALDPPHLRIEERVEVRCRIGAMPHELDRPDRRPPPRLHGTALPRSPAHEPP